MKSLSEFNRQELEAELLRRDQELSDSLKPKAKTAFNPDPLIELCESYLDEVWKGGLVDDDLPHYIFETAMICVFGEKIFDKMRIRRNK